LNPQLRVSNGYKHRLQGNQLTSGIVRPSNVLKFGENLHLCQGSWQIQLRMHVLRGEAFEKFFNILYPDRFQHSFQIGFRVGSEHRLFSFKKRIPLSKIMDNIQRDYW
jgi:hypothetical protein